MTAREAASNLRPRRDSFLVFGAPQILDEEIAEVVATLRSGWLGTGPRVARFERDFAAYVDVPSAAAVSSCTAALHLSLVAAGIERGDEVITSALTFCATVNAVLHAGGVPILADVDPRTLNLDPVSVEAKISPRTRAIVPVHFAGRPCDMDHLSRIADEHGLMMIEDCAHAIETTFGDRHAGAFGDFGCYSFYVTKNVVTGEGGMVVARRPEDLERIRRLALHGLSKDAWKRFGDEGYQHYQVVEPGFKYNMTDVQAALGLHQLQRVEENWRVRQRIWRTYDDAFRSLPIGLPAEPESGTRHGLHLYTVLIDRESSGMTRDEFLEVIKEYRIGVGVHYLSVPEHVYYQQAFGWRPEDHPVAMQVGRSIVSLPLSARLDDDDVADVVAAMQEIFS